MKLMTMLESSTMIPLPGLGAAGKAIPLTLTQREKKRGQRSATGHLSMKTSSPGKEPQQSFKLGLSQRSSNASTSVRTGQLIPPMWSGTSSSHLGAQTSLQTSGSTLSRGLQKSTFASLSLSDLTTSGPFISPPLVWVQVSQMEGKGVQGDVPGLPMQEGESPATTGIEAPATSSHRNAPTCMSATTMGVGKPTYV